MGAVWLTESPGGGQPTGVATQSMLCMDENKLWGFVTSAKLGLS